MRPQQWQRRTRQRYSLPRYPGIFLRTFFMDLPSPYCRTYRYVLRNAIVGYLRSELTLLFQRSALCGFQLISHAKIKEIRKRTCIKLGTSLAAHLRTGRSHDCRSIGLRNITPHFRYSPTVCSGPGPKRVATLVFSGDLGRSGRHRSSKSS
jgi:hypothetical protein